MTMNRRNVLIGLGGVAAGGGALLGSGAFSQVEAGRSVNLGTEGDASAQLGIAVNESAGLSNSASGDSVVLEFTDLNDQATTTFAGGLTITNNNSNNQISFTVNGIPSWLTVETAGGTDLGSNSLTIGTNSSVDLTLKVDTTVSSTDATTMTFVAETS